MDVEVLKHGDDLVGAKEGREELQQHKVQNEGGELEGIDKIGMVCEEERSDGGKRKKYNKSGGEEDIKKI